MHNRSQWLTFRATEDLRTGCYPSLCKLETITDSVQAFRLDERMRAAYAIVSEREVHVQSLGRNAIEIPTRKRDIDGSTVDNLYITFPTPPPSRNLQRTVQSQSSKSQSKQSKFPLRYQPSPLRTTTRPDHASPSRQEGCPLHLGEDAGRAVPPLRGARDRAVGAFREALPEVVGRTLLVLFCRQIAVANHSP